jgi:hypothetical protein
MRGTETMVVLILSLISVQYVTIWRQSPSAQVLRRASRRAHVVTVIIIIITIDGGAVAVILPMCVCMRQLRPGQKLILVSWKPQTFPTRGE